MSPTEATQTDSPGLTVAAVARRLGVSPSTLRTWDRRYGIGPGDHCDGTHRRYAPDDVARLLYMQKLVRSGVRVGEAATAAQDWRPATTGWPEPESTLPEATASDATASEAAAAGVRGLTAATAAMDAPGAACIIGESLRSRGTEWTWENLLRPVFAQLGRTWERTGSGVELEHLLSHVAAGQLAAVVERHAPQSDRPVLLACAPAERHSLPLMAVAAGLAERGVATRNLGAATPTVSLRAAARRLGPAAVVVWSYMADSAPEALSVPDMRPAPTVVAAGPGWPHALPHGVARAMDLSSAITLLQSAA